jgi:hypothetical protein
MILMTSRKLIYARSYSPFLAPVTEFLNSTHAEILLLAPSKGAADDFARRCCPAGVLGLHRMTLNQLAAALATPRLVAAGKAPASRLGMEALSARVAHALRKKSAIPYLAPVAAMPGFSKALTATLTELRVENFATAQLRQAGEPGKDLATLLALYEKKLDEAALADLPALLRLATAAALEATHRFANLPLILLDPPIDTTCARDLLTALVSRSPQVLAATLAGDDNSLTALAGMLETPAVLVEPATTPDRCRRPLRSYRHPASRSRTIPALPRRGPAPCRRPRLVQPRRHPPRSRRPRVPGAAGMRA